MKKLLLLLFIIVTVLSCKRTQTLRELDSEETLAVYPSHCYNSMMDGDETGVDCGGQCAACNVITPTCTPQANSINIGTLNNSATGTSAAQGSNYVFQGNYSGGYFTITLGGSNLPNQSIAYSIINSSFLYSNEASVNLNDLATYGSMDLSSGSLYISMVSGKYTVTICNGSAHSWITSQSYAITGKISFP